MNSEVINTLTDLFILSLPTLILIAAVLVIVLVLELLLRPLRLWYWRVDRHEKKLDHINAQLYLLRCEIGQQRNSLEKPAAGAKEERTGRTESREESAPMQKSESRKEPGTLKKQKPRKAPELREEPAGDREIEEFAAGLVDLYPYNKDRRGRVYTEEEIERQIRD